MDLFEEWVTADMNEDVTGPLSDTDITGGEESEPEVEPMPPAVMSCENEQDSDCEITSPTLPSPSEVIKMLQTSLKYFEKKNDLDSLQILHLKNCIRTVKDIHKNTKRQTTLNQFFKKM